MTLQIRRPAAAAMMVCLLGAAGCAAPPKPRATVAATAACRGSTEQAFNRQNRDLMSYRDDKDTPFSDSYNSGITSAGLSRRFELDQMMTSCLNNSGVAGANVSEPVTDGEAGGTPSLTAP